MVMWLVIKTDFFLLPYDLPCVSCHESETEMSLLTLKGGTAN